MASCNALVVSSWYTSFGSFPKFKFLILGSAGKISFFEHQIRVFLHYFSLLNSGRLCKKYIWVTKVFKKIVNNVILSLRKPISFSQKIFYNQLYNKPTPLMNLSILICLLILTKTNRTQARAWLDFREQNIESSFLPVRIIPIGIVPRPRVLIRRLDFPEPNILFPLTPKTLTPVLNGKALPLRSTLCGC